MNSWSQVTQEYMVLNSADIMFDGMYQRDLDMNRVRRIVDKYNPCLVNPVKVSFRDGKYYCFDGQHTVTVERVKRAKTGHCPIRCIAYHGLTRLMEMELFIAQNGESRSVNIYDKMRALYKFGDPDIIGMVKAAESVGVTIDFTRTSATNKVTALAEASKVYLRRQAAQFAEILAVLSKGFDGVPDAFSREMLSGMDKFFEKYYGLFKDVDLVKALSKTNPATIIRNARANEIGTSNSVKYARSILKAYNSYKKQRKLEDLF